MRSLTAWRYLPIRSCTNATRETWDAYTSHALERVTSSSWKMSLKAMVTWISRSMNSYPSNPDHTATFSSMLMNCISGYSLVTCCFARSSFTSSSEPDSAMISFSSSLSARSFWYLSMMLPSRSRW